MASICRNSAIDKTRAKEFPKSHKTNTIDDYVYGLKSESGTAELMDGIGIKELLNNLKVDQKFVMDCIYFKRYTHFEVSNEGNIANEKKASKCRKMRQWMFGGTKPLHLFTCLSIGFPVWKNNMITNFGRLETKVQWGLGW